MAVGDARTHEVTFCSRVSKWADTLFSENPAWGFARTEIEESKGINRKRSDLRIYDAKKKLVLAGEVKLPGTVEGRNAYNSDLIYDAFHKASGAGAEFFFTWNVNKLVLFDSKKWDVPLMERRLNDWDLGIDLDEPEDVSRPEVEKAIQDFLAKFFAALHEIAAGKKPDWGMAPDLFFIRAFESHISWPVKLTTDFTSHNPPRIKNSTSSFKNGCRRIKAGRLSATIRTPGVNSLTAPRGHSVTFLPTGFYFTNPSAANLTS